MVRATDLLKLHLCISMQTVLLRSSSMCMLMAVWCAWMCAHMPFIIFNNKSVLFLAGFLLVALISLPYEVRKPSPCNYFTRLSSLLPSFYGPSVFKDDVIVKCEASSCVSFSSKNKRVWARVTTGATASRLDICFLLEPAGTQHI